MNMDGDRPPIQHKFRLCPCVEAGSTKMNDRDDSDDDERDSLVMLRANTFMLSRSAKIMDQLLRRVAVH